MTSLEFAQVPPCTDFYHVDILMRIEIHSIKWR